MGSRAVCEWNKLIPFYFKFSAKWQGGEFISVKSHIQHWGQLAHRKLKGTGFRDSGHF